MRADSSLLFRSRVLFLTGKGGTGKTTLAAAVGRLAAAQGRRTVVVEVDNQRPSLTAIFGVDPSHAPREVAKNLSISNVVWEEALDDWLSDIVSVPRIVRLIMKNKVVTVFLTATPGARDLVMLWRIYQLSRKFELVVVDLPASGNATAMLGVPLTARRLFDSGPIRRCAEDLITFLHQKGVRLGLVALPEEMVVTETGETFARLRADHPGLDVPMVLLNRATPPSLDPGELALLARMETQSFTGLGAELVGAGRWEADLEAASAASIARLAEQPGLPVLALPVLARTVGPARIVGQVASALARSSSVPVDWMETG